MSGELSDIEKEMLSKMKIKPFTQPKDRDVYAMIYTFDRNVLKDYPRDKDFFTYIDNPEGKHLLECSGMITKPKMLEFVQDILRNHHYYPNLWRPECKDGFLQGVLFGGFLGVIGIILTLVLLT